jgi:hypothetical protein
MRLLFPHPNHIRLFKPKPRPSIIIRKMSTSTTCTPQTQPQFSSNYDPTQGTKDLSSLLHPAGKWRLIESGKGIERRVKFKGFKKCWVRFPFSLLTLRLCDGSGANV